jgi:uncharacterized phiE125 gp8 family phage protein
MAKSLITAPLLEPLTLIETKDHLRYTASDQDALISELIPAARRFAENYCQRALITQTWDFILDRFPAGHRAPIELPFAPLQSVTTITYTDTAGDPTVLSAALYQVDAVSEPGRVAPVFGENWPATRAELNAVIVRIIAGYGDSPADVPAGIRQGQLMFIGHMFERRESTAAITISKVPHAHEYLLDPYRILKAVS